MLARYCRKDSCAGFAYVRTLRYSFVASWYSLVIVSGGGRACDRMRRKRIKETAIPIDVYQKIIIPSPGGGEALGP